MNKRFQPNHKQIKALIMYITNSLKFSFYHLFLTLVYIAPFIIWHKIIKTGEHVQC